MKRVIAIVISFNDTRALKKTVLAINQQVHKTIIVDNGSSSEAYEDLCELESIASVECIRLSKNYGIATALNVGVKAAKEKGAEWILTLDQDSVARNGLVAEMLKVSILHARAGIIAPIIDPRTKIVDYVQDKDVVITSGNLVRAEIFDKIEYCSEYFIDSVDFEFCLNVRKNGWEIKGIGGDWLQHRLGQSETKKIFFLPFNYIKHSPVRRYYIFRNHVHLLRSYAGDYPAFLLKKTLFLAKIFFAIMLFDNEKKENLIKICHGLVDGVLKKNGSYESCRN